MPATTFEIPIDQRGYEIRAFGTDMTIEDGNLRGYAAVFDVLSEPLGGGQKFRERIAHGAFRRHLNGGADVRALWQHNPEYVLGRTKSGTLTVTEDIHGLRYLAKPPETQWAKDAYITIQRGDVDQSSFAFEVVSDDWAMEEGMPVRTVREARLYDVSPVTFPAYVQTTVGTRSINLTPHPGPLPEGEENEESGNSRTLAGRDRLRRRLELAEKI